MGPPVPVRFPIATVNKLVASEQIGRIVRLIFVAVDLVVAALGGAFVRPIEEK